MKGHTYLSIKVSMSETMQVFVFLFSFPEGSQDPGVALCARLHSEQVV